MRITIFARVSNTLNPYILLFKETIERQGLSVSLEREFNLNWLLLKSKFCDCIHLHWIHAIYQPFERRYSSESNKRFMESRYIKAFRSLIHLINVTIALFFARLNGKKIIYTVHDLEWFGLTRGFYSMLRRIAHHVVIKFQVVIKPRLLQGVKRILLSKRCIDIIIIRYTEYPRRPYSIITKAPPL